MRKFACERPVTAHFLLSLAIASFVMIISMVLAVVKPASAAAMGVMVTNIYAGPWYANIVTIAGEAAKQRILVLVFVFAAAPTIAALVLARINAGQSLPQLLSRLRPVGPDGTAKRASALYAGLFVVYAAGFFVFDWVAGPGVDAGSRLSGPGFGVVLGAIVGIFVDEGGTLEELGWRGFEFPLLQERFRTPLRAALFLGILHWAWHLPREIPNLLGPLPFSGWVAGQLVFLVLTISLSVVACYCVNLAGGSVWPAIFVHGGSNVWSKGMGDNVAPTLNLVDLRTLLVVLIALVIVAAAGSGLGRGSAVRRIRSFSSAPPAVART